MTDTLHPIALAHAQGLLAGRAPGVMPAECPWPTHDHEAVLAWFAGFSIGALVSFKSNLRLPVQPAVSLALASDETVHFGEREDVQ